MSWLPEGVRGTGGDRVERLTQGALHIGSDDAIRLAHRVLERFPEVKKRHMFIAGGAALSSALLIGAAVAIARRVRAGQNPQEAADAVTAEELEGLHLVPRPRRSPGAAGRDAGTPRAGSA